MATVETGRAARLRVARGDLRRLSPFERFALRLSRAVNESAGAKAVTHGLNRFLVGRWIAWLTSERAKLLGLDTVRGLRPDRGVVLAANHRSFFDMYVIATYLERHVSWAGRFFFPVRSTFFYDRPLGVAVNAAMSSLTMFPPIFRETRKRGATRAGLEFLAAALGRRGTVVGIHPEGTRGKGADPYELLPPEPGFGRLVLEARPVVVPVFVNGLGNDLAAECVASLRGSAPPIGIVFGAPVDLSDLAGACPRKLRAQVEVGRRVLDAIRDLAEVERRIRPSWTR